MTRFDFRASAHADEAAYLDTLESMVLIESPTHDRDASQRFADHLVATLEGDGFEVQRHPRESVGDVVVGRIGGRDDDDSTLILVHYDTVWPVGTLADMPCHRDGDRFYGPGALDMKAGIASAVHAIRWARAAGGLRGPVTILATSDEEAGSHHSRDTIEAEARAHARVLVLEPGRDDGALKVGRKGTGDVRVQIKGRSAHAGNDPEHGASALRELAHVTLWLEDLADTGKGTTVALTVAGGGTVPNVIAENAWAKVDVRVATQAEARRIEEALATYRAHDPRVEVELHGNLNRPPMELTDENAVLLEEAREHQRWLGLTFPEGFVGGGSDGNFTSAIGVATLDGLGSVGSGPHARHEHIRIAETLDRAALLASLLHGPDRG